MSKTICCVSESIQIFKKIEKKYVLNVWYRNMELRHG